MGAPQMVIALAGVGPGCGDPAGQAKAAKAEIRGMTRRARRRAVNADRRRKRGCPARASRVSLTGSRQRAFGRHPLRR
jgi:hypothetical protein